MGIAAIVPVCYLGNTIATKSKVFVWPRSRPRGMMSVYQVSRVSCVSPVLHVEATQAPVVR